MLNVSHLMTWLFIADDICTKTSHIVCRHGLRAWEAQILRWVSHGMLGTVCRLTHIARHRGQTAAQSSSRATCTILYLDLFSFYFILSNGHAGFSWRALALYDVMCWSFICVEALYTRICVFIAFYRACG